MRIQRAYFWHRALPCGLVLLTTLACAAWGAPPSGRPPVGPLQRYEPKLYDLTFAVTLATLQQINAFDRRNYDLENAPIVMPIPFLATYSRVDSESVRGQVWLNSREVDPRLELKAGFPFGTYLATLTVERFQGQALRWQVGYRMQSWSSRIDDEAAAKIAWPREWPKEVQDGLKPQMYIQSDDPIFAQTVERVTQGRLRTVPPYLAAKDLVRYCINELQVSGDGTDYGEMGVIRGMELTGALEAAKRQIGTPHDLVCVCVAILRAAGIPARPVIGVYEEEDTKKPNLVSWAEFYLPDAGWVPFDPWVMRGKGIRTLDVRKPWPEFGTMKDLNERIPLAFHFIPPASIESPRNPAVWGWDPRPGKDPGSEQYINITIIGRGRGEEDPR